jgi:hypothetical protein
VQQAQTTQEVKILLAAILGFQILRSQENGARLSPRVGRMEFFTLRQRLSSEKITHWSVGACA